MALTRWAAVHGTDIAEARARYDADQVEIESA